MGREGGVRKEREGLEREGEGIGGGIAQEVC